MNSCESRSRRRLRKVEEEIDARYFTRIGTVDIARTAIAGGGEQAPRSVPRDGAAGGAVTPQNTSVWSETEMVNNRPTPDRLEEVASRGVSPRGS